MGYFANSFSGGFCSSNKRGRGGGKKGEIGEAGVRKKEFGQEVRGVRGKLSVKERNVQVRITGEDFSQPKYIKSKNRGFGRREKIKEFRRISGGLKLVRKLENQREWRD